MMHFFRTSSGKDVAYASLNLAGMSIGTFFEGSSIAADGLLPAPTFNAGISSLSTTRSCVIELRACSCGRHSA